MEKLYWETEQKKTITLSYHDPEELKTDEDSKDRALDYFLLFFVVLGKLNN